MKKKDVLATEVAIDLNAVEERIPCKDSKLYFETPLRFRSRYDGRQDEASDAARFDNSSDTLITKQAFKDEANINTILKKYNATGVLPNSSRAALAQFGDFSGTPSYKESLERVIHAQEMFSELPSAVRNRFRNDPGELLGFLSDSRNRDEAVRMGLIDPSTGKPPLASDVPGGRTSAEPKGKPATPVAEVSDGE